jgi:hypothetical protein
MLRPPLTPPPDFPDFPDPFFRIQYLVASYEAIDFPPGTVPLFHDFPASTSSERQRDRPVHLLRNAPAATDASSGLS